MVADRVAQQVTMPWQCVARRVVPRRLVLPLRYLVAKPPVPFTLRLLPPHTPAPATHLLPPCIHNNA
mgnify:CR=1 FL=1